MTEKENILHFLKNEPCENPPAFVMLMGSCDYNASLDIPVCERPMHGSGYDVFGVHWTGTEAISHRTPNQKPIYDDIEDWREHVRFPNVEKFDWTDFAKQAAAVDRSKQIVTVVLYTGPFERLTELTSFEDCLVNVISDPENFSDLIGAVADYKIALIKKIAEIAHPDVFYYHDDWGTSKSTFMSPELWRETIKPHTKRVYDAIHEVGALVCQHSCGAVTPLIPDMIEMGADMWDGQDTCNDKPALREKYGSKLLILEAPPHREPDANVPPPKMPCEDVMAYPEVPEFLYEK